MPTSIARLGREKTVSTLAKRLFVIEGPDAREKQRRAERALLRANPSLGDPERFKPGAAILVPAVVGLKTTDRVSVVAADLDGALEQSAIRLKLSAQMLQDSFARAAESDKTAIQQLGDRSFGAKLRKALPESTDITGGTAAALKARIETNQQRMAQFEQGFEKAMAEIDRLKRLTK